METMNENAVDVKLGFPFPLLESVVERRSIVHWGGNFIGGDPSDCADGRVRQTNPCKFFEGIGSKFVRP